MNDITPRGLRRTVMCAGGVGVLFAGEDIAAVVVGVDPGLAGCLVVLPEQLVQLVVDIGG